MNTVYGLSSNSVNCRRSLGFCWVAAWQQRQLRTMSSVLRSIPGNQTAERNNGFVVTMPWWPSWLMLTTLRCKALRTTIRDPWATDNSDRSKLYGPRFSDLHLDSPLTFCTMSITSNRTGSFTVAVLTSSTESDSGTFLLTMEFTTSSVCFCFL